MKRKGADYHHGDLRRALVEATLKLVAEHGMEGFTLRAAARLAGVSDGAPYHHFADKEALLAEVAHESYALLSEEMARAAQGHPDERSKSLAMGVAYVHFAARHPSRFRLMFGLIAEDRRRHPELAEAVQKVFSVLRRAFADALRDAEPPSARSVSLGAWALVHGLSWLAVDGHLSAASSPRRLERLAREALAALDGPPRRIVVERDTEIPSSGRRVKGGGAARERGGAIVRR